MKKEIGILYVQIIDYKRVLYNSECLIQYRLEIITDDKQILYCWKYFNDFISLCNKLIKEKGYKKKDIRYIPKNNKLTKYFEKFNDNTIKQTIKKLNIFLKNAVCNPLLQWGIYIDKNTQVYKRRIKN